MSLLGGIGQMYMFLLLVLLFLGFGLGTWAIIKTIFVQEPKGFKNKAQVKTNLSDSLEQ